MKWAVEGARGVGELGMQGRSFQKDNPDVVVGERIYFREADLCSPTPMWPSSLVESPHVGWLGEGGNNQEKVGGGFSEAHSYPFHEFTLVPALGPFQSYNFSVTPF